MAKKFLVSLDLNKNELQNARVQNLGTAPSSPVTGQVYYNTTDNTVYVWDNTAWVATDAAKVAAGTIPLSKLVTDPLARANHTGTQAVSTITGLASVATSGAKADVGLGNVDNTSNATERAAIATLTNKTINLTSNTLVATSAQIATAVTDETGTGVLVFGTSPTLATPVINGLPTGSGVASANTASTLVSRDSSGNFAAGTITATLTGTASGNVTAVTGTGAIVSSGGLTPAISIVAATTSVPGTMSAADKSKLDGVATGATANSTDAFLLSRTNHTGTQTASTISNFDTQVRTNRLDQLAAPSASVAMNSQKLTGLANGSADSDSAAFGQIAAAVDAAIRGMDWKDAVRVASAADITIASALINGAVIDGITVATGDRVLLKNQSSAAANGVYVVVASGAASRSVDTDTAAKIKDMSVLVAEGTLSEGFQYKLTTDSIILGTTSLTFVQHGQGATAITAGDGLTASANVFNVVAGSGISVSADAVAIDPSVVVRKFAATIGDGSAVSIAVTHSLNNQDAVVSVRQVSDNVQVFCDVTFTSANVITLGFAVAPASNALRVSVQG